MQTLRERVTELIRFGLVGALSTLVYLGFYAAIIGVGGGFVLAALTAFALSATLGFFLHHRFTFRIEGPTAANGMARWLLLQGTVVGVNIALLALLVHGADLNRIVAQVILLPVIPLLTFIASRQLVFRPRAVSDR
ncbi:MAG TPA: GtrA family protein [Baekduia sp.]|nr:GtrA family protein [Baekduia sp.]